jgi:hypothetical protein
MKKMFKIFVALFITTNMQSQVSVTSDLPSQVSKNIDITLNVKINKGPIKNYSKFEMLVPSGIEIKEIDVKNGAFTFENNKVRIVWAITPAEPEYVIMLSLSSGTESGIKDIKQTYAYVEKGQKLELEMPTLHFTVIDSDQNQESINSTSDNSNSPTKNDETINASAVKTDTKEAQEIGNNEKLSAQAKIEEANLAIQKAEYISDPKEKNDALQLANEAKKKAEADLASAERILSLSNSINQNSNDIEKLNQPVDSIAKVDNANIVVESRETTKAAQMSNQPAIKIDKAKENAMNSGAAQAKDLYKDIKPEEHHEDQEIQQQISQLKLDSKDALEVGKREKFKAEQNMHDAYDALKKTKYMPEGEEKKLAIQQANEQIEQAKGDLEIASKILTLSKSLEENAKEIERLHINDEPKNAPVVNANISNNQQKTNVSVEIDASEVSNNVPFADTTEQAPTKEINKEAIASNEKSTETNENVLEETNEKPTKTSSIKVASVKKTETKSNSTEVKEIIEIPDQSKANSQSEKTSEPIVSEKQSKSAEELKPKIEDNANNMTEGKIIENPISEVKNIEMSKEKIANEATIAAKNNNIKGLFTLQLGSFINQPDLSKFKKLGKVEVKTENGKYKVYYGKYSTKSEASDMRQKTVSKGFDCFVVTLSK